MLPRRIQPRETSCKVCGGVSPLFGVCDFVKNCSEPQQVFLPLEGIPVYYYRCQGCQFLFTRQFDRATQEEIKAFIYNEGYTRVDPDHVAARPEANARFIQGHFLHHREILRILDYGGGEGLMGALLRGKGFDVTTYDPFYHGWGNLPDRTFNLITAFEVMEHSIDPVQTAHEVAGLLDGEEGAILFSTQLQPDAMGSMGMFWWYIGPRNGHVSLYSGKSLAILLEKEGLGLVSLNLNTHLALRGSPRFLDGLFGRSTREAIP